MMYILTAEEYQELYEAKLLIDAGVASAGRSPAATAGGYALTDNELQVLCTKIADEMPVNWGWNGPDPKPWGCTKSFNDGEWCCDQCPVIKICPEKDKCWSK